MLCVMSLVGCDGPCNVHPLDCKTGTSCWLKQQPVNTQDPGDNSFSCVKNGPGRRGDACDPVIGLTTCGDGLACYPLVEGDRSTCLSVCDPQLQHDDPTRGGCAQGETCTYVIYGVNGMPPTANLGYAITICIPPCPPGLTLDTSNAFYPTCHK